jgi:hypothetical protein
MPGALPAQQDGEPAGAAAPAVPGETAGPVPARPPEAMDGRESAPGEPAPDEPAPESALDEPAPDESAQPTEPEQPEPAEEGGPRPLGLHVEPTGNAPVDGQLRRLEDADHLAVSGHLEVYEDVHRGLREALAGLDRPAPGPGPTPGQAPGQAPGPGHGPASAHGPGPGRPVPGPQHPRS